MKVQFSSVQWLSHIRLFATPWTAACQASLSFHVFHGSIYPKLKFWGKSVEAEPKRTIILELLEHNEAYTWTNPTCCVHNIIVGKLWIEQYGNVEITNHK